MPQSDTVLSGFRDVLTRLTDTAEPWHFLLAALILLILSIVLIGALARRNRRYDDLLEEREKQDYAAQRMEKERQQALGEKDSALRLAERERERALEEKDEQLREKDEQLREKDEHIAQLTGQVGVLTRFRDEYVAIPDARAEAARIVREAKEHAYLVSSRTEMEYAELIEHANQEAESIRSVAQQRLARSHDTLKAALARAKEIVEEAHATSSRLSQMGVAYVPAPRLIEAPSEAEAQAEPSAEPQASAEADGAAETE